MLNMRIVRSPLKGHDYEAILREYNRLTSAVIPMNEFVHWVQNGPEGAAWHAILETEEGRIVGHTSAFPMRTEYGGPQLIPAKSEFSFVHESFRSDKIRRFETVARPAFLILIDQLFQHCYAEGWGPIFASTNERNQIFSRKVGLRPIEFPLCECLFVLRPKNAARHTPNLESRQRVALFAAGVSQRMLWSLSKFALGGVNGVQPAAIDEGQLEADTARFSFFEDSASLRWRYLDGQYVRLAFNGTPGDYLIAKRGSEDRFLRVCQWRFRSLDSYFPLLVALIREAQAEGAMGVRWAVYDHDPAAKNLVRHMRRAGFLCARRVRTVMIHKKDPAFLAPELWNINDSLFSFDP
jgi:hypothetical protein